MVIEQKFKTVLDSYKFVFRNLKTECIEHENGKDNFNYVSKD